MQTLKGFTPILVDKVHTEKMRRNSEKLMSPKRRRSTSEGGANTWPVVKDVQRHIVISGVQFTDWTVTD